MAVITNGGGTVRLAEPLVPPAVAVIVAVPLPTAIATPSGDTVATAALSVDHVTARPNTRSPAGVRSSVWNDTRPPVSRRAVGGVTVTDPTAPPRTARHVPVGVPQLTVPLTESVELEANAPL
jgi:hypothetical protein